MDVWGSIHVKIWQHEREVGRTISYHLFTIEDWISKTHVCHLRSVLKAPQSNRICDSTHIQAFAHEEHLRSFSADDIWGPLLLLCVLNKTSKHDQIFVWWCLDMRDVALRQLPFNRYPSTLCLPAWASKYRRKRFFSNCRFTDVSVSFNGFLWKTVHKMPTMALNGSKSF